MRQGINTPFGSNHEQSWGRKASADTTDFKTHDGRRPLEEDVRDETQSPWKSTLPKQQTDSVKKTGKGFEQKGAVSSAKLKVICLVNVQRSKDAPETRLTWSAHEPSTPEQQTSTLKPIPS
jgi:hypothetical protein